MHKNKVYYAVASWEPRFQLSFDRALQLHNITDIAMYYVKAYSKRTQLARETVARKALELRLPIEVRELPDQPGQTWRALFDAVENIKQRQYPILDISTMPRDIMWTLADLLLEKFSRLTYLYSSPSEYSKDWLSRDPDRPRLIAKLSGEARLGIGTALLLTTGFDVDRIRQLIRFFEPQIVLLGVQTGEQFDNRRANTDRTYKEFGDLPDVHIFSVDAYDKDHGLLAIEEALKPYLADYNIIMSSLGPKLSAIALYRIHRKYPQVALAYAPSRDYNIHYSSGIGKTIQGELAANDKTLAKGSHGDAIHQRYSKSRSNQE
jgi:hypothetical protein